MKTRFTNDGSDELENHLERACGHALTGVQALVPERKLEALVLAGGYGRGEGGVLKTAAGDEPYNDLEFYVFIRGNRLWNDHKYSGALRQLGERLSPDASLHVEFKVDSLPRLRRCPISMFTYDLVARQRVIFGDRNLFIGCENHHVAESIPLSEAARLLLNRCTGLLLVQQLLGETTLGAAEVDFIGRNLAKAQLALGDVILAVFGQYHWSCSERHSRLAQLAVPEPAPFLAEIRQHHLAGMEFKLHPRRSARSPDEFRREHREISALASGLWLWLESRRLNRPFASAHDYSFNERQKCPETSAWRNYLLNVKSFGPKAGFDAMACRYPRERLFNALPLLLWNGEVAGEPSVQRHLQKQLQTGASDWTGLVAAYKQAWSGYG